MKIELYNWVLDRCVVVQIGRCIFVKIRIQKMQSTPLGPEQGRATPDWQGSDGLGVSPGGLKSYCMWEGVGGKFPHSVCWPMIAPIAR